LCQSTGVEEVGSVVAVPPLEGPEFDPGGSGWTVLCQSSIPEEDEESCGAGDVLAADACGSSVLDTFEVGSIGCTTACLPSMAEVGGAPLPAPAGEGDARIAARVGAAATAPTTMHSAGASQLERIMVTSCLMASCLHVTTGISR